MQEARYCTHATRRPSTKWKDRALLLHTDKLGVAAMSRLHSHIMKVATIKQGEMYRVGCA